jgi:hypothetical protein
LNTVNLIEQPSQIIAALLCCSLPKELLLQKPAPTKSWTQKIKIKA